MSELVSYNSTNSLSPLEFAYLWQEMGLPEVKKQVLLQFNSEELYNFIHNSLDNDSLTAQKSKQAVLPPSLPLIKTKEDLDAFIQKGWDDVQAGRVFSLEEMDNKLNALKAKYVSSI